jgi:hypothetical protein
MDKIIKAEITPEKTITELNLVANKPEAIWVLSPNSAMVTAIKGTIKSDII